jgi:aryl-alcohol dehydrogenase-like predicted oxidoreductase
MRYHLFGQTGLRVSELFLGTMTFGEQGGVGAAPEESREIFEAYVDAGGTVVDTASNYRDGASEEILGGLLEGRRDRFVVMSKYTVSRDRDDPNGAGNHRKNLRLSLERSLRRLCTDYLDVYWVHVWDRYTPVEETMRALDDEVRAGRILYVGISDTPAWIVSRANTLAEWRGWSAFAGLQIPYSLLQRDVERDLLPMADASGMAVAAWGPLAGGILSGKYTRPDGPGPRSRIDPGQLNDHQRSVAAEVQAVAHELGATPSQVAIAWTRAHSPAIHPIVGARTVHQLLDNIGATAIALPSDARARLEAAAPFDPGFPTTFIREITPWVFGSAEVSSVT